LHQGSIRGLLNLSGAGASEIAQRVTNLFCASSPIEARVGKQTRFLEERLIHRTERGEMVRSKSELLIADKLYSRKIPYQYEASLKLGSDTRYPDFTIVDDNTGKTFYWEHLGMLEDPVYEERWRRKLELYKREGIIPYEEGEGGKGTLIVTRDLPGGGFDSADIARIIDSVIQ